MNAQHSNIINYNKIYLIKDKLYKVIILFYTFLYFLKWKKEIFYIFSYYLKLLK